MNAELITTGTEILLGEIVDTNAAWMAQRLRGLGINLFYKTTVGDNLERIAQVMRQGLERSDLVLVSGGLGPTVDDVTRDAAALATDRELVTDPPSLKHIQEILGRWGRTVMDNNRRQAMLPDGATTIYNPVGTAPGFVVEFPRPGKSASLLICLPGVPREMKHLMESSVEPMLAERLGADRVFLRSRTLRTVGIGESAIDSRIDDLMRLSNPTVGLAAHLGQADVRITGKAASEAAAQALVDGIADDIIARLGRAVYGEGDVTLEEVLVGLLQKAGSQLALVETNTSGELAERLQAAPGGAAVLAWSEVLDVNALSDGRPAEIVSEDGARWALELAAQAVPGAWAMAVCGTVDPAAGPYGAYRGETWVAIQANGASHVHRIDVGGIDELARRWSGNGALNTLRLQLLRSADNQS